MVIADNAFLRFSVVGTIGFLVDSSVLMALTQGLELGPLAGRFLSFAVAVTVTWYLNRRVTFRAVTAPTGSEWLRYAGLTAFGALINIGVYRMVLALAGITPTAMVAGVAAGSVAALGFNYTVSKRWVFAPQAGDKR